MKQESEQFKVEATPVIDLKKAPASDIWDNEKTEVYLEDEAGNGAAFLLTAEGEYIPISAFPFVIGRGNECDLVLNRKGLSRKHAEIVFQSGRFVVNDLDSLNGLKVNGYKVARVILEEGDSIKLGEVSLVFTSSKGGGEAKVKDGEIAASTKLSSTTPSHASSRSGIGKKAIYGTIVIAVVALVGVGVFTQFGDRLSTATSQRIVVVPNPSVSAPQKDASSEAKPDSSIAQNSVTGTTAQTGEVFTDNVVVDPVAPPPSIALGSSISPPEPSNLPPPSRNSVETVVQKPVAKPVVAKVQPVISKPAAITKTVPKEVQQSKPVASLPSNIDARYLSGDAESLLKEMSLEIKSSKANDAGYQSKYNKLLGMYNKYTSGKQAMIEGRKEQALSLWSAFLQEEKALFGSKKSAMASAASSRLVDEYVSLGNNAARAGKNHEAYKYWQKSIGYGDSVPARIAIDAANQKSKQLYRQALRLEYVNTERAKELWRQVMEIVPPGTEYYTKASSKLAWYDKWGA